MFARELTLMTYSASRLWECGVQADLHVWSGGLHGIDLFLPNAELSKRSLTAKLAWVRRMLKREH
jgi:hypothetical protein